MFENLNKYNIVLASNSPRRRELLAKLGIDFEVRVLPDIEECYPEGITETELNDLLRFEEKWIYECLEITEEDNEEEETI